MKVQKWEVTLRDGKTGAVFTTCEEVFPPMAQAQAEVKAIRRHPEQVREHLYCARSRFLEES